MKVGELKKGMFFHTGSFAKQHNDYGPLQVVSLTVKTEKYNTTWNDMWSHYPDRYIDRDTLILKFRNEKGKVDTLWYWKDECEKGDYAEERVFPLNATNFADAHNEWERYMANKKLNMMHRQIGNTIAGNYEQICSLTMVADSEENETILKAINTLHKLLNKPKK